MSTVTAPLPPALKAGGPDASPFTVRRLLDNRWSVGAIAVLTLLIIWQVLGAGAPFVVSTPSAIFQAGVDRFFPEVLPAFAETLKGLAVGLGISIVVGIPVGLLMSYSRIVELALAPYVSALYATPRIVLIPILVLLLGISFNMRVGIVVLSAVFPILLNTYLGGKEVNQGLLDVGRAFTARPLKMYTSILLRGSLPYVFTGIRLGLGRGLIGVIIAEVATSAGGVGNSISNYAKFFRVDAMFVMIVLLGILAMVLTGIIGRLENYFTAPWARATKRVKK